MWKRKIHYNYSFQQYAYSLWYVLCHASYKETNEKFYGHLNFARANSYSTLWKYLTRHWSYLSEGWKFNKKILLSSELKLNKLLFMRFSLETDISATPYSTELCDNNPHAWSLTESAIRFGCWRRLQVFTQKTMRVCG